MCEVVCSSVCVCVSVSVSVWVGGGVYVCVKMAHWENGKWHTLSFCEGTGVHYMHCYWKSKAITPVCGGGQLSTHKTSKGQNEHPLSFSQPSFSVFPSFWLLSSVLSGGFNSTMNKCNIENVILMHNALTLALCVPSEMFSNSWQRCFAKISCLLSNVWFRIVILFTINQITHNYM